MKNMVDNVKIIIDNDSKDYEMNGFLKKIIILLSPMTVRKISLNLTN